MKNRIIKTEDGFTFVNVTDLALTLFATNKVELFEQLLHNAHQTPTNEYLVFCRWNYLNNYCTLNTYQ